jgi:hypothetical protein
MDWVQARLDCSSRHVWIALREAIRSDVARWKILVPHQANIVEMSSSDSYIMVSTHRANRWVRVESNGSGVTINRTHPDPKIINLTASLNVNGECRLWQEIEELEFWQASKLAIEAVLFLV